MFKVSQSELVSEVGARRLRRDRNWFAVCAVAMIAIAIAFSMPRRVQRYRSFRDVNIELRELQRQVAIYQESISNVENKITVVQQEILMMQTPRP